MMGNSVQRAMRERQREWERMSEHETRKMLEELVRHGLMERRLSASGEESWRMTELGRQLGEHDFIRFALGPEGAKR
jgi:hypothetical protein